MCGIFGLIQPNPFDPKELGAMSQALRHRGPDDEGVVFFDSRGGVSVFGGEDTPGQSMASGGLPWLPARRLSEYHGSGGGLALGHRRLSIIDLSPYGHQPMASECGRFWITYNGEIYNYIELREELQAVGYRFVGGSDTEVILAAYQHWGEGCLSRFNGMWAFAIFDRHEKDLFLARDRFGVKPFYYWSDTNRLAFASEIKAFVGISAWRAFANRDRVQDFLAWNVLDHSDQTMFKNVHQLLPGHCVKLNISAVFSGGAVPKFRARKWYFISEKCVGLCGQSAVEELRWLLADSVRLRLRADVPVGSCLSGGLDSSTIVCLMGEQLASGDASSSQLHTFTARSRDFEFDEFNFANSVIERAGALPHTVTPEPNNLFDEIDRLAWHQDEPFVSTSIYAQWCVFKLARSIGVPVMLDGQGADEILGGYRGFFGAHLAGILRFGSLRTWWHEVRAMQREIGFSLMRSIGYTAAYLMPEAIGFLGRFDGRSYSDREWLTKEAQDAYSNDPFLVAGGRPRSVRDMSLAQIGATNLPMLLHWEDRNSMAHSVEARVPFLDYRVVEHCLNLADVEKVGHGISKRALRQAMRGIVPDLVLDRRDKMGFVTAETLWVRRDEPKRFRSALVDAVDLLPGFLSPRLIERFDEVLAGRRPFDHRYWRAVSTSRWVRAFQVEVSR